MHWMLWMEDCWMVGNSEFKWHAMDVQLLRIGAVEVVDVEGNVSFVIYSIPLPVIIMRYSIQCL